MGEDCDRHARKPEPVTRWFALPGVVGWLGTLAVLLMGGWGDDIAALVLFSLAALSSVTCTVWAVLRKRRRSSGPWLSTKLLWVMVINLSFLTLGCLALCIIVASINLTRAISQSNTAPARLRLAGVVGWTAFGLLVWVWVSEHRLEAVASLFVAYVVVVTPAAAVCGVFFTCLAVRKSDGTTAQNVAAIFVTLVNLSFAGFALWLAVEPNRWLNYW